MSAVPEGVCAVTCHGAHVTGSAVPEQWALGRLSAGDPAAAFQAEPQLGSSAWDCWHARRSPHAAVHAWRLCITGPHLVINDVLFASNNCECYTHYSCAGFQHDVQGPGTNRWIPVSKDAADLLQPKRMLRIPLVDAGSASLKKLSCCELAALQRNEHTE